jgi:hypothetical protein
MEINKMKLSEILPHLQEIANQHELKLNRVRDFNLAVFLLKIRFLNYEKL